MLLWILMAALMAAAVMAVLAPLGRAPLPAPARAPAQQVFLQQMEELERDEASGRLTPDEARAMRAEVGRRIIESESDPDAGLPQRDNATPRRIAAIAAIAGIPALSLGLYLLLGDPDLPGQPLAVRLQAQADGSDVTAMLAKVEAHLAASPQDGQGWDVIAPVYLRLGRADEAAGAFRNAIRILGSSAARQEGLGQAIFASEQGIVTADARAAFEAARAADPAAPGPHYFLGLAAAQEGNLDEAKATWRALLAEAPPGAAWRPAVEQALAQSAAPPPGGQQPAPAQVAAEGMTKDQQAAMIEGMVSGLAQRLDRQPDDVEGWLKLVRSYVVLRRPRDASEAARQALQSLPRAEDRGRVQSLVADLGVTPSPEAAR